MADRQQDSSAVGVAAPRLRRFRRPIAFLVLTIVLIAVSAGSFFAGYFAVVPERDALTAAQDVIQVTASAEIGAVDSGASFGGEMMAGSSQGLVVSTASGRPIVTRQAVNSGDQLELGGLIGSVAGVPYFALSAPLPLFRDLHKGDKGDDVKALQSSLRAVDARVNATGVVDYATMVAIRKLWSAADLAVPEDIPYLQLIPVAGAGTVVSAARLGDLIDEGHPLVTIRTSSSYVRFRADAITAEGLSVGQVLVAQFAGTNYPATVTAVGPFDAGGNGIVPGHDISLGSTDDAFLQTPQGTKLIVHLPGSTDGVLRVPVSAVRQDSVGDYVNRETTVDGKTSSERIGIQVLRNGNGWVALGAGELQVGDKVVVS